MEQALTPVIAGQPAEQQEQPGEVAEAERPWRWTQTTGPFLPFLLVTPVPLVGHPNEVQPQALRRVQEVEALE